MREKKILKLTLTAIFSAISVLLYLIKFPLPIFPAWLEVNFSMIPILFLAIFVGGKEAVFAVILRYLIKLTMSNTGGIGELSDLILGLFAVIVFSVVYRKSNDTKRYLLAAGLSSLAWIFAGCIANKYISIPLYFSDTQTFANSLGIIPGVTPKNAMFKYLLYAVAPFNLILSLANYIICFIVYLRFKNTNCNLNKTNIVK